MKRDRFYKTSAHRDVGNNVTFHAINGKGYVTNIDDAEIFSLEEAQSHVDKGMLRSSNEDELFLSADHVDELSLWKVDSQYIEYSYPDGKDPNDEYVLCEAGVLDGNDLSFAIKLGTTFDYSVASVFSELELTTLLNSPDIDLKKWVAVPKFHTDEIARRTFNRDRVNRRKMISGAGLIGILKKKEPKKNPKTRWRCPSCGKIVWQYDPFDFGSCHDTSCSRHVPDYDDSSPDAEY